MGNSTSSSSSKGADQAASGAYSPTPREENVYDSSFPPVPPSASASSRYSGVNGTSTVQPPALFSESTTPPVPPRGLERRSHTVVSRDRRSETVECTHLTGSKVSFTHLFSLPPSFSPPCSDQPYPTDVCPPVMSPPPPRMPIPRTT